MRTAALILAFMAAPLATPTFAATSLPSQERNVETCNAIADTHGVTGYARSKFVQQCFERQSSQDRAPSDRAG